MKTLSLIIINLFSILSYAQKESDLKFIIFNKSAKDGDSLSIFIENKSSKNYYILYDKKKTVRHFTTNKVYHTDIVLSDDKNTLIGDEITDYQCYDVESQNELSKLINNIEILKIKSREKIKFKIPFFMKTKVNDYCWYGYQKELMSKKNKYFISFEYKMYSKNEKDIIPLSTKDSLKKMGYEFYYKEINSNKVPLIW
jgi:hypothetical protein